MKSTSNLIFFLATFMGLVLLIASNPLPQQEDATKDYGDFEGNVTTRNELKNKGKNGSKNGTGYNEEDPIGGIVGDILTGAGFLVQQGIDMIQGVANGDKKLGDTVEEAVLLGMNATHEAARIGVNVVSAAPKILEEKAQFVQGLGKTVAEHGGRVKQGLNEIGTQTRVASAIAKTYGEAALDNLTKFLTDFHKRLKCNTKCEKLDVGSEARKACVKENCIEIEVPNRGEEEDEYDYSYGAGLEDNKETAAIKDDIKNDIKVEEEAVKDEEVANDLVQVSPRTAPVAEQEKAVN